MSEPFPLPDADNQKRLLSERQPKTVACVECGRPYSGKCAMCELNIIPDEPLPHVEVVE